MDNLEKACCISCEKWSNSFSEYSDFAFGRSFEKRMDKLIDKMRDDKYHRLTRNAVRVIIIAAILLSLTVSAFAFPSTRKYIIKRFQNYFSYSVTENAKAENIEDISVEYIPKDFVLTDENNDELRAYRKYEKDNLWFSVFKMPIDAEINFNNANQETVEHNNIEYVIYSGDKSSGVIWNNGAYVYKIDGNISKDELLKTAYEVK